MFDVLIEPLFSFVSGEYAELFAASRATAFQHPKWLDAVYRKLLPGKGTALIITVRRDQRSTNAPASGEKSVIGTRRAIRMIVVTSVAAPDTTRPNPRAAMKLNQLPSSEMTCPINNRLKERLRRRSWK